MKKDELLQIRIDSSDKRKLKSILALEGKTISAFVQEAVKKAIENKGE